MNKSGLHLEPLVLHTRMNIAAYPRHSLYQYIIANGMFQNRKNGCENMWAALETVRQFRASGTNHCSGTDV